MYVCIYMYMYITLPPKAVSLQQLTTCNEEANMASNPDCCFQVDCGWYSCFVYSFLFSLFDEFYNIIFRLGKIITWRDKQNSPTNYSYSQP